MARIAVDSGGRYTERTNDFSLAYARAERDLACVYSLGFYVESNEDTPRGVSIRVRRKGVRAVGPNRFVVRSPARKRESLLKAAWVAPEMFQSGLVRAHLFPLRPASKTSWDGLLAVAFAVPLDQGRAVRRDFGAVLSRPLSAGGAREEYRFNRRITLQPDRPDVTSKPVITFLQRVELEPGSYSLTAVLTDADAVSPHAVKVGIEVPEIPRKGLFLVGPMLGRRSGPNLVVLGNGAEAGFDRLGEENSFEPLLVQQLDQSDDLLALTQACLVGAKKIPRQKGRTPTVERRLARTDGREVGSLEAEPLLLDGEGKLRCQNLVDLLPAASLRDGEYVFEAELGDVSGDGERGTIRFAISDPGAS